MHSSFKKDRVEIIEEAKKAAELAEQAREVANQAKEEYNELQTTITSYKDGVNGIKELTRGTVEWKEQISKTNEEALKLLQTYKGLTYIVNEDGLIQIDETSLAKVQAKELEQMQNATTTQQLAELNKQNKELIADQTEFNRKYAKSSEDDLLVNGGKYCMGCTFSG